MRLLLPILALSLLTGCETPSIDSRIQNMLNRRGSFHPDEGFSGYETYSVLLLDGTKASEDFATKVMRLRATGGVAPIPARRPDVRIEAYNLGSEEGDVFGIWIEEEILGEITDDSAAALEWKGYRIDPRG